MTYGKDHEVNSWHEIEESSQALRDYYELHPDLRQASEEKSREEDAKTRWIKNLHREAVKLYRNESDYSTAAQRLGTAEALFDTLNYGSDFLGFFSNFGHHPMSDVHTERGLYDSIVGGLRFHLKQDFNDNWQKGREIVAEEEKIKLLDKQRLAEENLAKPKPTPQQEYDAEKYMYIATKKSPEEVSRKGAGLMLDRIKEDYTSGNIEAHLASLRTARLELRCQSARNYAHNEKDRIVPGAIIGSIVGLIGGPIGATIGAAIGGKIGSGISNPTERDKWTPVLESIHAFQRTLPNVTDLK